MMKPPVRRLLILICCWVLGYAVLLCVSLAGWAGAIGVYGLVAATPIFAVVLLVLVVWLAIASTDRL
jgi:hypothetical protein